jgi:hypothetical protein
MTDYYISISLWLLSFGIIANTWVISDLRKRVATLERQRSSR